MRRGPVWLLAALTCVGACESCCDAAPAHLAILEIREGPDVDRDHDARRLEWERASPGATFELGDGVRTGRDSGARVGLTRGGGLHLDSETLVRFLPTRPDVDGPGVSVETGSAALVSGPDEVVFETQVGVARLSPGGRVRLTAVDGGLRFEVTIGRAELETAGGPVSLAADDDALVVTLGGAVIETRPDAGRPPPAGDAGRPPLVVEAGEGDGVAAAVEGAGAELRGPGADEARALAPGPHRIAPASTVRLPGGSRIALRRGDEQATIAGPAELVVGAAGEPLVSAQSGSIEGVSGASELSVRVPGGTIVLRAASAASLRIEAEGTRVTATRGGAELRGRGPAEVLEAGDTGFLARAGAATSYGAQPASHDLAITAGESVLVHDPAPPTSVRVRFGAACGTAGTVEVAGRGGFARPAASFRGLGAVNLSIAPGVASYRLICGDAGDEVATGTIRVLRDPGVRRLSQGTPRTTVEADGRRYTVLYQGRLPAITFRWREAPAGGATLTVIGGPSGTLTQPAPGGVVSLPSGRLGEGDYRFQFAGGGAQSPSTSIRVGFDNASPTAYVVEPAEGAASPGTVQVSGGALPGSTVRAGATTLTPDAQGRFAGAVSAPGGQDALVIRVTHPQGGSHVFLRHFAGAGGP